MELDRNAFVFWKMAWAKSTRKIQHMIPTKRCMHGKSGVILQINKNQGLDRGTSYVASQTEGPPIEIKYLPFQSTEEPEKAQFCSNLSG